MRIVVAGNWVVVMLFAAVGCDSAPSDSMVEPPLGPCASIYNSAFNACIAANPCYGFGCLDVWQGCSNQAKGGAFEQCCARYVTDEERQLCFDSHGQEP